jgi:hypothetical protein
MITLLEHKTTLAYLAYLGYPDEPRTGALLVTRPRKHDRRRGKSTRNVFLCYVCGAAGSGKTSFLRSFADKPFDDVYRPTEKVLSVVNSVDIHGSEKYLVVSCIYMMNRIFLDVPLSYRSLVPNMSPRCSETRKKLTWLMLLSTCMIQATQTRFHTSAI